MGAQQDSGQSPQPWLTLSHSFHVSTSATHGSSDPPPGHSQSTALAVEKVTFTQNITLESVSLSSGTEVPSRTSSTLEGSGLPHGTCTRICCNSEQALTKQVCEWNDSTDPCSTSEIAGELCVPSQFETGNSSQVLAPACAGASRGSGRQMPSERETKEKATQATICLPARLPAWLTV